jgi:hypothetical protein
MRRTDVPMAPSAKILELLPVRNKDLAADIAVEEVTDEKRKEHYQ